MCNTIVGAGAGAGAASRYGSGFGSCSDQKMRLLAAPAPQHCFIPTARYTYKAFSVCFYAYFLAYLLFIIWGFSVFNLG
jgi:hypothetical protein